jgi:hypothetical protein
MKEKTILYVLAYWGIFLFSCTGESSFNTPLEHFEDLQSQKLHVSKFIDLEKYTVYKPASVIKTGDNYVIYNQTHKNIISYIDVLNNEVLHGVKRGEAPDEIISPSSFQENNGNLLLYDIARKIFYKVNIEDQQIAITEQNRLPVQERLFVTNLFLSGVIASGIFEDSWIRLYNEAGSVVSSLSFPDFSETRQLTGIEKSSLYISSIIASSPDQSRIVCTTPNAGVLSFSKVNEDGIEEYKRLQYGSPLIKAPRTAGASSITFDRNNMVSFCGLSCENDYIIALYSGRTFNSHGMSSHHCEHILIYDWDGNPTNHFLLEKPLYSLGYDRENKIIYGIGYDPEGAIIEYDLKILESSLF